MGADLYLAAPVLDQCRPDAVRRRNGPRNPVGGYLRLGHTWRGVLVSPHGNAVQIKSSQEVWTQLKQHLNNGGSAPIDDKKLVAWFLDPDIEFPNPSAATNAGAVLLINTAGSLQ